MYDPGELPFLATIEATEEAIYNSLFKATDAGKVKALPVEEVLKIVARSSLLVPRAGEP